MSQVTYYDDYLTYKEDYDIIEFCPECLTLDIRYDPVRDEITCHQCGLVLKSSDNHGILGPTVQVIEDLINWKDQTVSIKGVIGTARGSHYNPRMENPSYQAWRIKVLRRDGFMCTYPGCRETSYLHAHHIQNYSNHKELRHEVENGLSLCRYHHLAFHNMYGYHGNTVWEIVDFFNKGL